jgi:hypothetical protein
VSYTSTPRRVSSEASSSSSGGSPRLFQYWRSFEVLERLARNPKDPHPPSWRRFNQTVGSDGSVGIWHETYIVQED